MTVSLLSKMLDLTTISQSDGQARFETVIDPVFTIGPKVHGGSLQMVAAKAAHLAFIADVGADAASGIHPLAVTSNYLAAPDPAQVELVTHIRKRGRTVSLVDVEVVQGGRVMVTNSVVMGRPDSGEPRYSAASALHDLPVEPPADAIDVESSVVSEVVHLGPAVSMFLDTKTFAVVRGEQGPPVFHGWARPKGIEPDLDFTTLVCDISPPVVMNLGVFGWAPTVQLSTYLRREPAPGWLRFQSSSTEIGRGMFEEDHLVIDSTGTVVAQSRQLALIPNG